MVLFSSNFDKIAVSYQTMSCQNCHCVYSSRQTKLGSLWGRCVLKDNFEGMDDYCGNGFIFIPQKNRNINIGLGSKCLYYNT